MIKSILKIYSNALLHETHSFLRPFFFKGNPSTLNAKKPSESRNHGPSAVEWSNPHAFHTCSRRFMMILGTQEMLCDAQYGFLLIHDNPSYIETTTVTYKPDPHVNRKHRTMAFLCLSGQKKTLNKNWIVCIDSLNNLSTIYTILFDNRR